MPAKSKRKQLLVVCALFAATLFAGPVSAQQPVDSGTPEAAKTTIFDYQKELGLADAQVNDIRTKITDLDRKSKLINAKLTILNVEIQELNDKNGDLDALKKKVSEAYSLVAELKIADFTTTREINAIMKPAQLEQWRKIQQDSKRKPDTGKK